MVGSTTGKHHSPWSRVCHDPVCNSQATDAGRAPANAWLDMPNVFNVMVLGQLALNLLGFLPYLWFRTKMPSVAHLKTELGGAAEG